MIKLIGLCGSLRKESFNRMLLYEAIKMFKKCKFEEIELELPLYNSDIQNNGFPEKVKNLGDSITNCDGIIIVSPEYNKGVSGVLKNALDWTSRINRDLWKEKPVVIMSVASGKSGGETGQFMLRSCMIPLGAKVISKPMVCVANGSEQFDENRNLISERYKNSLKELMENLFFEIKLHKKNLNSNLFI